jgi:hypothetical protein
MKYKTKKVIPCKIWNIWSIWAVILAVITYCTMEKLDLGEGSGYLT